MKLVKLLTFALIALCSIAEAQQKTDAQLAAQLLNLLPDNSVKFITPANVRKVTQDGYDARISIYGNLGIKGLLRYNTLVAIANDKDIVHKKYVDDAIAAGAAGVSSFNTRSGAVVPASGDYTTDQVIEGSNLFYTNARARLAMSATNPVVYDNSTGAFSFSSSYSGQTSITTLGTVVTGTWNGTAIADPYISSAATWNSKQTQLSGTGFVKATGSTISYDNSTYALDNVVVHNTGTESGLAGTKSWTGQHNFSNDVTLTAGSLYMNDGQYVRASSGNARMGFLSGGSTTWYGGPGNISFGSTGADKITFQMDNPNNGTSLFDYVGNMQMQQNGANATGAGSQRSSYKNKYNMSLWNGSAAIPITWAAYGHASTSVNSQANYDFEYNNTTVANISQTGGGNFSDSTTISAKLILGDDLRFTSYPAAIRDISNKINVMFLQTAGATSNLQMTTSTGSYSLLINDPGSANSDLYLLPQGPAGRIVTNSPVVISQIRSYTSAAPTISAGAGAGTAPTATVTGTDAAMSVSVAAGTLPSVGSSIFTVTFNKAYAAAPKVVALATSDAAAAAGIIVKKSAATTTTFTFSTIAASSLTAALTYSWDIIVVQ